MKIFVFIFIYLLHNSKKCIIFAVGLITIKNNKIMAYVCVDSRGEFIADEYPTRAWFEWVGWRDVYGESCTLISLPKGTIKKLIGKEMTWEDEPIELPLNMFCN